MTMEAYFNPRDWYWIIRESGVLYGSARDADVDDPETDRDYRAWQAAGGQPSRIANRAELRDVLVQHGVKRDTLTKIEIIRRVAALGLLADYDAAMRDPDNVFFARAWEAAGPIKPGDPDVRAFFATIAADTDTRDAILSLDK